MSKLERITFTVPEEMAAKLRAAVDTGGYATTSEVVREALRGWSEEQAHRDAKREWVRKEIEKGTDGPFADGPEFMDKLLERVTAEANKRRAL